MFPKGLKHTEETKARISATVKNIWQSPEFRAKISVANKDRKLTPEHIAKIRVANTGKKRTLEHRAKLSASHLGIKHTPETQAKMSLIQKEHWKSSILREKVSAAHRGKKLSLAHRTKISIAHKGIKPNEETRIKIGKANKGKTRTLESKARISTGIRKYYESPEARIKRGTVSKRVWQNMTQECRDKIIQARRLNAQITPNKAEVNLLNLLETYYPSEWRYVGDGQIIIGGKNPDFINVNGRKLIIELYGDYWHNEKRTGRTKEEEIKYRENIYSQYGYRTLIVWEEELEYPEKILERITEFEYIGKTYIETKQRPRYVIKNKVNF